MSKRVVDKSALSKRKSAALAHILGSSKRSLSTMRMDLVKFIESYDKIDTNGAFDELVKFVGKTQFAPKHAWFVFLAICEALRELGTRRNEAKRKSAGKGKEKEDTKVSTSTGSSSETAGNCMTSAGEGEEKKSTTTSIELKSDVKEASKSPSGNVLGDVSSLFIKTSPSNEAKAKETDVSKSEESEEEGSGLSKWLIPMKTAFDAIGIESIDLHDPVVTGVQRKTSTALADDQKLVRDIDISRCKMCMQHMNKKTLLSTCSENNANEIFAEIMSIIDKFRDSIRDIKTKAVDKLSFLGLDPMDDDDLNEYKACVVVDKICRQMKPPPDIELGAFEIVHRLATGMEIKDGDVALAGVCALLLSAKCWSDSFKVSSLKDIIANGYMVVINPDPLLRVPLPNDDKLKESIRKLVTGYEYNCLGAIAYDFDFRGKSLLTPEGYLVKLGNVFKFKETEQNKAKELFHSNAFKYSRLCLLNEKNIIAAAAYTKVSMNMKNNAEPLNIKDDGIAEKLGRHYKIFPVVEYVNVDMSVIVQVLLTLDTYTESTLESLQVNIARPSQEKLQRQQEWQAIVQNARNGTGAQVPPPLPPSSFDRSMDSAASSNQVYAYNDGTNSTSTITQSHSSYLQGGGMSGGLQYDRSMDISNVDDTVNNSEQKEYRQESSDKIAFKGPPPQLKVPSHDSMGLGPGMQKRQFVDGKDTSRSFDPDFDRHQNNNDNNNNSSRDTGVGRSDRRGRAPALPNTYGLSVTDLKILDDLFWDLEKCSSSNDNDERNRLIDIANHKYNVQILEWGTVYEGLVGSKDIHMTPFPDGRTLWYWAATQEPEVPLGWLPLPYDNKSSELIYLFPNAQERHTFEALRNYQQESESRERSRSTSASRRQDARREDWANRKNARDSLPVAPSNKTAEKIQALVDRRIAHKIDENYPEADKIEFDLWLHDQVILIDKDPTKITNNRKFNNRIQKYTAENPDVPIPLLPMELFKTYSNNGSVDYWKFSWLGPHSTGHLRNSYDFYAESQKQRIDLCVSEMEVCVEKNDMHGFWNLEQRLRDRDVFFNRNTNSFGHKILHKVTSVPVSRELQDMLMNGNKKSPGNNVFNSATRRDSRDGRDDYNHHHHHQHHHHQQQQHHHHHQDGYINSIREEMFELICRMEDCAESKDVDGFWNINQQLCGGKHLITFDAMRNHFYQPTYRIESNKVTSALRQMYLAGRPTSHTNDHDGQQKGVTSGDRGRASSSHNSPNIANHMSNEHSAHGLSVTSNEDIKTEMRRLVQDLKDLNDDDDDDDAGFWKAANRLNELGFSFYSKHNYFFHDELNLNSEGLKVSVKQKLLKRAEHRDNVPAWVQRNHQNQSGHRRNTPNSDRRSTPNSDRRDSGGDLCGYNNNAKQYRPPASNHSPSVHDGRNSSNSMSNFSNKYGQNGNHNHINPSKNSNYGHNVVRFGDFQQDTHKSHSEHDNRRGTVQTSPTTNRDSRKRALSKGRGRNRTDSHEEGVIDEGPVNKKGKE